MGLINLYAFYLRLSMMYVPERVELDTHYASKGSGDLLQRRVAVKG